MPANSQIGIYENRRLLFSTDWTGAVELGRQGEGEGEPYFKIQQADGHRVVLARRDEEGISRQHARLESLPDGRVRVVNKSATLTIRFADGSELRPRSSRETQLPLTFFVGSRMVRVDPAASEESAELQSLADAPEPPGARAKSMSLFATVAESADDSPVLGWLQAALNVLESAAISVDFFDRAAEAVVDTLGFDTARVLLLDKGRWTVRARKSAAGVSADDRPPSESVLTKVLEQKKDVLRMPPVVEGSLQGVDALVAAPILDRGKDVIGVLYGDRSGGDGRIGGDAVGQREAKVVELLAQAVAAGLDRLEQQQAALQNQKSMLIIERDLQIGRDIQFGFLPEELVQVPGWETGVFFRPARQVSGDFYDLFRLPHGHLALVIADVCDKGIGAALFMTLFRSLLRVFAENTSGNGLLNWRREHNSAAGDVAARSRDTLLADLTALVTIELTNNYVAQMHAKACMFATVFFGVLNTATGALTYVNAGHDAPVLVAATGGRTRLYPTGPVVGINPNVVFGINPAVLEPGDALFAYTDGVTEARDPSGQFFTEKRLLSLLDKSADTASVLLDGVAAKLRDHIAGAEPYDDVTMLAVRRKT